MLGNCFLFSFFLYIKFKKSLTCFAVRCVSKPTQNSWQAQSQEGGTEEYRKRRWEGWTNSEWTQRPRLQVNGGWCSGAVTVNLFTHQFESFPHADNTVNNNQEPVVSNYSLSVQVAGEGATWWSNTCDQQLLLQDLRLSVFYLNFCFVGEMYVQAERISQISPKSSYQNIHNYSKRLARSSSKPPLILLTLRCSKRTHMFPKKDLLFSIEEYTASNIAAHLVLLKENHCMREDTVRPDKNIPPVIRTNTHRLRNPFFKWFWVWMVIVKIY